MDIIKCPQCDSRVLLMADGRCPACLGTIETTDEMKSPELFRQRDELSSTTNPAAERIRYRERSDRAREHFNAAWCYFVIGLTIACGILILNFVIQKIFGANCGRGLVLLASPFFVLAIRARYTAKRLSALDARTVLANDRRSPVLYLRSFYHDGSGLVLPKLGADPRRSATHEESLAETLQRIGPVIAIGRPGEEMPELGAYRMYVAHDRWQDEVKKLMNRARLVVLRLGSSPGLTWEFETMVKSVRPERIILYLEPPGQPPAELWQLLPCVAISPPIGRYIYFSADWTPHAGRNLWLILYKAGLVHITDAMVIKIALAVLFSIAAFSLAILSGIYGWLLF